MRGFHAALFSILASPALEVASSSSSSNFLSVSSDGFTFRGKPVILSGANMPWLEYGEDFGNHQTEEHNCLLQAYVRNVSLAGGNSIRMWVFVEGEQIPQFGPDGHANATDASNTLISDLRRYIRYAASQDVFVNLVLWNGARMRSKQVLNFFDEDEGAADSRLASFIANVLTPMAHALKDEPGLMSWEIMNEPEMAVKTGKDDKEPGEPCFDASRLGCSPLHMDRCAFAGFNFAGVPMRRLQKFVNLQSAAIKAADPKALVTVGAVAEFSAADKDPTASAGDRFFFDYWKDECLVKAGGQRLGTLDYTQIHTYAQPHFLPWFWASSPMRVPARAFNLTRPLVIGEFAVPKLQRALTAPGLYSQALSWGYAGVWGWSLRCRDGGDREATVLSGVSAVRNDDRVHVDIKSVSGPVEGTCKGVGRVEGAEGSVRDKIFA